MCQVFEVSESGYYSWKANKLSPRKKRDIELTGLIKQIHQFVKGRYGSPRIHSSLKDQGERVSRKRVNRLMQENNIHSKVKRKFKVTTNSNHNHLIAPNLLEQNFIAERPNQLWVSDIT
jgi:putative transposase